MIPELTCSHTAVLCPSKDSKLEEKKEENPAERVILLRVKACYAAFRSLDKQQINKRLTFIL